MKKGAKRNQIISELLHVTDEEFTDEELIHQLIATEVTKNADKDEHIKSLTLFWKTKRRSTAAWIRLKRRLRRKTRKNNALHIKIWEIVLKKHHHP